MGAQKFAIYSRKSKFTGKGESIENQIELCKDYINKRYSNVTENDILIFEDEGFSGKNIDRPQFQNMMKEAKEKKFSALVCYRLDRISRNVGDFANLIKELDALSISFISIKEQFDTSSPMGRAMMYISSVFSQLERETTAERIRDNMQKLAKTGRWLGGTTPTGYQSKPLVASVTIDGRERKAYKLDIVKKEADIVILIYRKFLQFNSLTKTETYLLQNHIQTKNENNFSRFSIRAILQNPVYTAADKKTWNYFKKLGIEIQSNQSAFDGTCGIMAYNKTLHQTGRANQIRDFNDWIVAVGKHKPIIGSSDWITVQKMLNQNKSKAYKKPRSNVALLSGLLFCGNCGDYMRPKLSKRYNLEGERIYSYLCETKEKSRCQNCNMKNPNGNTLDKAICEEMKKLSENSTEFLNQLKNAKQNVLNNQEKYSEQQEALQKELSETESAINSLLVALEKSDNSPAFGYITQQINTLDEKKKSLEKQSDKLKVAVEQHPLSDSEFDILRDLLKSFGKSFNTMSVEQKRLALRVFIKRIVWDGQNVHVYLFGSDDTPPKLQNSNTENQEPLRAGCK